MLRVGLTGGLGSGKTTVAAILRSLGAQVMEADAVGRAMMQPGEAVKYLLDWMHSKKQPEDQKGSEQNG